MAEMDHCISQLYCDVLKHATGILDYVRVDNFILVRVVGHNTCMETYSVLLRPVGMSEDNGSFKAFKEWADKEYPGTCCYCYNYDDYSSDWEEDYYDVVHDDAIRKVTKQERRDMRNKNYRDRDGRYR
jgi:hypothetical protein